MSELKFKTNINCDGCIARVTPALNSEKQIIKWSVDTVNPEKILTIETDGLTEDAIVATLRNTGFKAEPIHP